MRRVVAAVLVCAALLTIAIVSPAVGGPSIGSVAKTAKKALTTARKADRKARSALRVARSGDGAGTIRAVSSGTSTDPSGVAAAKATCPSGTTVISGGHDVGVRDTPASVQSYGQFYGVISVNLVGESAEAKAHALCVKDGLASSASLRRSKLERFRADVAAARSEISGNAVARASHRCSGGRVHAVLEGDHKCLGPGQYCAKRHQKKYKRKGFVCKNGRLKRR